MSYRPTVVRPHRRETVLLAVSGGCAVSHRCSRCTPCHQSAAGEPLRATPRCVLCTCSGQGGWRRARFVRRAWASPVLLRPRQTRPAHFHGWAKAGLTWADRVGMAGLKIGNSFSILSQVKFKFKLQKNHISLLIAPKIMKSVPLDS
jgi:hypothetical protein